METSTAFRIVRRGYDPAEVHAYLSRLVGERDSALRRAAALEERPGTPADGSEAAEDSADAFAGFHLARRGYERGQVDEEVARLVRERDLARTRVAALRARGEEPA